MQYKFKTTIGLKVLAPGEPDITDSLSCRQAEITFNYKDLVFLLGEPTFPSGDKYKTDVEWRLQNKEGNLVTVYNWKDGINYNGPLGTPVNELKIWQIGGNSKQLCDDFVESLFINIKTAQEIAGFTPGEISTMS